MHITNTDYVLMIQTEYMISHLTLKIHYHDFFCFSLLDLLLMFLLSILISSHSIIASLYLIILFFCSCLFISFLGLLFPFIFFFSVQYV